MTLVLLLLGCAEGPSDADKPAVEWGVCADGEIRLASTGAAYGTLAAAVADAADVDRVCVGAGTFPLYGARDCVDPDYDFDGSTLVVEGAGSDRTRLEGGGDACADFPFDATPEGGLRALSGVTLWNASTRFSGGDAVLEDVRVAGYVGAARALRVHAETLSMRGVTFAENTVDYGAGFEIYADGTIEDLIVEGNRSAAGYVGEIAGTVTWVGGRVEGNVRTAEEPGYDFLETWGDVTIADVAFTDNRVNGPVLTTYGALALTDVRFVGNDANYRGVLTSYGGALTMTGGAIEGNHGADGAVALYTEGTAALDGVDLRDNDACAVSGNGACLVEDTDAPATLACDVTGCE